MYRQFFGGIKSKDIVNVAAAVLFLAGAGIFLYPAISDMWNQYRNAQLISGYETATENLSDNECEKLWKEAKAYNAQHTVNSVGYASDGNDEYQMFDPNGDGLMGSIEIPKIRLRLAIYQDLGEEVLEKGAGHMEGTSLPVGGRGTHAVLAAHRGLPGAKLFTDLDQMEEGDIFLLHILDRTLAYEVDQIRTVLPTQTGDLDIIEGEDHVTLVTCTPYGVNTHRLLVRGVRTKYVEEMEAEETVPQKLAKVDPKQVMLTGLAVLSVLILALYLLIRHRSKKHKEKMVREKGEEAGSDERKE